MTSIQEHIFVKFLERLAKSEKLDAEQIEQLRQLLVEKDKPKADDFVQILSRTSTRSSK